MSGLIYAAIVAMWAAVLVPMWLRRHESSVEARSVERFSSAMRILSRRPASVRGRQLVMPRRAPAGPDVHVSGASAPIRRARPARSLAARRRRALLGLLAVVALTAMLAVAHVLPWTLQLVVDLLLVGFVGHLRRQAALRRPAAAPRRTTRPAAAPAARPARRRSAPAAGAGGAYAEPVQYATPVPAREQPPAAATGTDGGWQPVPVPPPTYTLKPPAPDHATRSATFAELFEADEEDFDDPRWEDYGLQPEAEPVERRRAVGD